MQHPGCLGDRGDDDAGGREEPTDLVAEDLRDRGTAEPFGRCRARLVDRPEDILCSDGCAESQVLRLVAAAFFQWREATGIVVEIDDRDTHRGRPQVAVRVAEEESLETGGGVARARGDRDAVAAHDTRWRWLVVLARLRGDQRRACERATDPDGKPNKRRESDAAHAQGHGYSVMAAGRFFA